MSFEAFILVPDAGKLGDARQHALKHAHAGDNRDRGRRVREPKARQGLVKHDQAMVVGVVLGLERGHFFDFEPRLQAHLAEQIQFLLLRVAELYWQITALR